MTFYASKTVIKYIKNKIMPSPHFNLQEKPSKTYATLINNNVAFN